MNHAVVPAKLRRDAGRLEPAGISLCFVAKHVVTRVPADSRGGTCPWRFPAAKLVLPEKEHSSIIKFLTPTITRGPEPFGKRRTGKEVALRVEFV